MNNNHSFGAIVKEHRRLLDLTQTELARRGWKPAWSIPSSARSAINQVPSPYCNTL